MTYSDTSASLPPPALRPRRPWRKAVDTVAAYIRIDVIEDVTFPLSNVMRYIAVLFPVFMYLFQARYLGRADGYATMLIGISVAAGLQDALTGFTGRLQMAQERGTLETYLVEPVPWALIPLAMNIWRSITGVVMAALMVTIGWIIGADLQVSHAPAAVLVLLLGVAACNAVGVLAASFLMLFKRGEPVIAVYGLGAAFFGGALFNINVLPPYLRWISYLVPHAYVISAEREILVADNPGSGIPLRTAVIALVIFCIVAFVVGLWLFNQSLEKARALGILST
jgi:ABC-2 type transport system permease protein